MLRRLTLVTIVIASFFLVSCSALHFAYFDAGSISTQCYTAIQTARQQLQAAKAYAGGSRTQHAWIQSEWLLARAQKRLQYGHFGKCIVDANTAYDYTNDIVQEIDWERQTGGSSRQKR